MVNYRREVCEVALMAAMMAVVTAAPTPDSAMKYYDQRQNGTENYRLNIDGVVIAVAPPESLITGFVDVDYLLNLFADIYHAEYRPERPQVSPSKSPSIEEISLPMPEVQPQEEKPAEEEPQEVKPEEPAKPAEPASPLSDVSRGNEN